MTATELEAALADLGAMSAIDEFTGSGATSPDQVFDDLLSRLGEAA